MADAWHVFASCGFASWLCMLVAMLATALGVPAIALAFSGSRGAKTLACVALAASLFTVGAGVFGMLTGRAKVDSAVDTPGLDPSLRERIRVAGYEEADGCVKVGGVLALVPFAVGAIAVAVAFTRDRPESSPRFDK